MCQAPFDEAASDGQPFRVGSGAREKQEKQQQEKSKKNGRPSFGVPSAGLSEDLRPYNVCVQYRYVPPLSPGLVSVQCTTYADRVHNISYDQGLRRSRSSCTVGAVEASFVIVAERSPTIQQLGLLDDGRADVVERGAIHEAT